MSDLEQIRSEFEQTEEFFTIDAEWNEEHQAYMYQDGSQINITAQVGFEFFSKSFNEIESLKERIDNLENQLIEYQTMLGL